VIVTTENSGYDPNIWAISLDSSDNATITGIGYMNQPEDSIFVTQESVVVHGGGVPDGGSAATMLFLGMLSLGALAYRRKSLNEGDPVALHKI
jgi:hypothetical protein